MSILPISLWLFLGLVSWISNGNAAEYSCKESRHELNFTLCASTDALDHGDQVGCGFVCMLTKREGMTVLTYEATEAMFYNWCLLAKPDFILKATPRVEQLQLLYSEFVVLLGAIAPACLRESLIIFDDIVTVDKYKITQPDTMTSDDLWAWNCRVGRYCAGQPEEYDEDTYCEGASTVCLEQYWKEKIMARIKLEKITCKREFYDPD